MTHRSIILLVPPVCVIAFSLLNIVSLFYRLTAILFLTLLTLTSVLLLVAIAKLGRVVTQRSLRCLYIAASILYVAAHHALYHAFVPLKCMADARATFVSEIVRSGNISTLGRYEELEGWYYTRYPSVWITAALVSTVASLAPDVSLRAVHAVGYALFIITISAILWALNRPSPPYLPLLIIAATPYLLNLSQSMSSANTLGVLGLAILLAFVYRVTMDGAFSLRKLLPLLLITPLLFVSPVYVVTTLLLFLLLTINALTRSLRLLAVCYALVFLIVVSPYLGTLYSWLKESGYYHYLNLAIWTLEEALSNPSAALARPTHGGHVEEQMVHFVLRPYSHVVAWLYYLVPIVTGLVASAILLLRDIKAARKGTTAAGREIARGMLSLDLSILQVMLLYLPIIYIFGYKALENFLARYAYTCSVVMGAFQLARLVSSLGSGGASVKGAALSAIFLTVWIYVINLEVLYAPWFSLYAIPDVEQLKELFHRLRCA